MFSYEKSFWRSKKWLTAAATLLVITLKGAFPNAPIISGLSDDQLILWVVTAVGYIASQGYVDANTRKAEILAAAEKADPH